MIGNHPFRRISTADNNAALIYDKPTHLTSLVVGNINAAMAYLKLFDKASAPTVGTDTPVFVVPIPGGAAGTGLTINLGEGLKFTNGLALGIVTGIADSNNTGVAANEVVVSGAYT